MASMRSRLSLIHPSAWKGNSAKFALIRLSEVPQRYRKHLGGGGIPQAFRRRVHPASERLHRPLRPGEQVLAVHHDRGAAGKPDPLRLLVCVDRY
jgi:hypothetical protein